jgi:hypothetical protein
MILIPVILFFSVLFWDVTSDVKKWRKNFTIYHTKEAWLRCCLLIPSTRTFTVFHPDKTLWILVLSLLMQFFTFWFLFDGLFNRMRGFKWNQPPSLDGKDNSFFDKFYGWWAMIIKVTGMILAVALYALTWFF